MPKLQEFLAFLSPSVFQVVLSREFLYRKSFNVKNALFSCFTFICHVKLDKLVLAVLHYADMFSSTFIYLSYL